MELDRREGYRRDGGNGLPLPGPDNDTVWLFTCVACGRRWTDPFAPIIGCGCGGNVVGHQFERERYNAIRTANTQKEEL
jgi:hypothetical protein